MKRFRSGWTLLCAAVAMLCLATVRTASAHPVSVMTGQAVVRSNEVAVTLEVMIEDFMLFYGLSPDMQNRISRADIQSSIDRHAQTLLKDFAIRDVDGVRLKGELVKRDAEEVPADGYDAGALMQRTVTYRFRYPMAKPPTHLTFQQTLGRDTTMIPASLELEVRQEGLSASDQASLSNQGNTETFEFSWDGKGERAGETPDEGWRRRRDEQKKARMGITSYGAIYGFVYITDHEVRAEILVPLATLETWVEVPRKNPEFLEVDEQAAARKSLEAFFCGKNKVKIDGIEVKPTMQRLDFYGVRFTDFASRPEASRLSAVTARAGVILSYSTKGPPSQVDMTWEYFNASAYAAQTVVYAYALTYQQAFTPFQPTFTWKSPAKRELPKIAAVSAGGGASLSDDGAKEVAGTLLRNIYRAFDYHAESDIYDALARSVQGDLLAELYLKIHDGLAMQEQGGAIASVQDVRVTASDNLQRGKEKSFSLRLTWTVEGTVEHWGHIHTRVNEYSADFTVQPVDDAWKITGMKVTDQKRVRYQVRLRSF